MHGTETKADPKADSTLDDTPGSLQDAANPVLPNEVRVEILDKLSGAELRQLSSKSPEVKKLVDSAARLQYKVELSRAGLLPSRDTASTDISVAREQVRRREEAWNNFRPTRTRTPDLRWRRKKRVGIFDNIAWFEGNPTWNFHQLSPEPMWNLPAQWNITAPGFRVRSITASPEQDLLVLVEEISASGVPDAQDAIAHKAHFLSLSTGAPHPSASTPVIRLDHEEVGWTQAQVHVFGGFVAIMVAGESVYTPSELWVLDWKEGVTELNAYTQGTMACTFEVLENNLLLVPVIEPKVAAGGSPRRIGDEGGAAFLYVYDCKQRVCGRLPYQDLPRVATFKLPELSDKALYDNVYSVTEGSSAQYTPGMGRPFVLDPSYRLFALQLQIGRTQDLKQADASDEDSTFDMDGCSYDVRLLLFVHATTIQRRCEGDTRNLLFEWEDWAHEARLIRNPGYHTDWFGGPLSYTRSFVPERTLGNVNGIIDFAADPEEEYGGDMTYWLYEFAPSEVLRSAEAAAGGNGPWVYFMEPDSLPKVPIFRTPTTATSGLPYRKLNTGISVDSKVHPNLEGDWIITLTQEKELGKLVIDEYC